jgi:hypothetical protein
MGLAQPAHSMIMLAAAAGCRAAGWARPAHIITVRLLRDGTSLRGGGPGEEETGEMASAANSTRQNAGQVHLLEAEGLTLAVSSLLNFHPMPKHTDYHSTLRYTPEERKSHQRRGGSLKPHTYLSIPAKDRKFVPVPSAYIEFFTGGGGADPEATHNLCLVLKIML